MAIKGQNSAIKKPPLGEVFVSTLWG